MLLLLTSILCNIALSQYDSFIDLRKDTLFNAESGKRWPRSTPIPFRFDFAIHLPSRQKIRRVLRFIEEKSCVRFVENPRNANLNVPTVHVINDRTCWSRVGAHFDSNEQNLSIPFGCTDSFGVVAHEIFHLLGFEHTQTRIDRNNHIKVNESNIKPKELSQYEIHEDLPSIVYRFPYEFGSVMHYAAYGNSLDADHPTILPKNRDFIRTIGQRLRISFLDLLLLNEFYGCFDPSKCLEITCKNGGVPNCSCFCPKGFSGERCDDVEPASSKNPNCSTVLEADSHWKAHKVELDSGVRNNGENLFQPEECWVHLEAPLGHQIEVRFVEFSGKCDHICSLNGVELKTRDFEMTGLRDCCAELLLSKTFTSSKERFVIGAFARNNATIFSFQFRSVRREIVDEVIQLDNQI
ncbi:unnamed protein product, partial [Mesorhabditis belari]|uniref:Zinc metalloproteinase n=1 Tax=Mesorhabditis belari TaxID=2138241 RepID=A0AAF3FGB4_9BILA